MPNNLAITSLIAAFAAKKAIVDEEDVRVLGARLAADSRSRENHRFAERFTDEHRETFDRLSQ